MYNHNPIYLPNAKDQPDYALYMRFAYQKHHTFPLLKVLCVHRDHWSECGSLAIEWDKRMRMFSCRRRDCVHALYTSNKYGEQRDGRKAEMPQRIRLKFTSPAWTTSSHDCTFGKLCEHVGVCGVVGATNPLTDWMESSSQLLKCIYTPQSAAWNSSKIQLHICVCEKSWAEKPLAALRECCDAKSNGVTVWIYRGGLRFFFWLGIWKHWLGCTPEPDHSDLGSDLPMCSAYGNVTCVSFCSTSSLHIFCVSFSNISRRATFKSGKPTPLQCVKEYKKLVLFVVRVLFETGIKEKEEGGSNRRCGMRVSSVLRVGNVICGSTWYCFCSCCCIYWSSMDSGRSIAVHLGRSGKEDGEIR